MIILIAIATFISTLIGGLFALKLKDKLHLVLGFSAGAVLGVAFFDLIPESIELGLKYFSTSTILSVTAIGFFIYLILDRLVLLHGHSHDHEDDFQKNNSSQIVISKNKRGTLGATSLAIHSFFDGVIIGLAFQASTTIGWIVAIAVLVHDFSDGINAVSLIIRDGGMAIKNRALWWLLIVATAPILGATSTLFFSLKEQFLGIVLAIFSGFFLYIGASDLIPESHHAHPKFLTTIMTLLGVAVLYIAVYFAN